MIVIAKWGKVDFKDFKKLEERINKLQDVDFDTFCEKCSKELAQRLLAEVIKNTLPGEYPPSTGKKGGTLRRGWTANYSKGFAVTKTGNCYEIELVNDTYYASYVEYGHRTRNHKGWVKGKFILTNAEGKLEQQVPAILEKRLQKFLQQLFK